MAEGVLGILVSGVYGGFLFHRHHVYTQKSETLHQAGGKRSIEWRRLTETEKKKCGKSCTCGHEQQKPDNASRLEDPVHFFETESPVQLFSENLGFNGTAKIWIKTFGCTHNASDSETMCKSIALNALQQISFLQVGF